jgi:hypothetical protein
MMMRAMFLALPLALTLSACETGGTSTREMERAAMDRTRQELGLAASTPLEAKVWTGAPFDGQVTLCGTVSSDDGTSNAIAPQRFAATGDPVKFLVFEPAHQAMRSSRPGMFQSWAKLCAQGQER